MQKPNGADKTYRPPDSRGVFTVGTWGLHLAEKGFAPTRLNGGKGQPRRTIRGMILRSASAASVEDVAIQKTKISALAVHPSVFPAFAQLR